MTTSEPRRTNCKEITDRVHDDDDDPQARTDIW